MPQTIALKSCTCSFAVARLRPFVHCDRSGAVHAGVVKFAARVDRLIDETKQGERAANVDEILIPGERELKARERSLKEGVRLLPSTYRALVDYGRKKQLATRLVIV